MRKTLSAALFLVLLLATSAQAVVVQVDWSARISSTNTAAPGPGLLSGSFGVFDVNSAGDQFVLPSDGSLTALATDFTDGFPNGSYSLTRTSSQGAPILEFLSIGSTAADFAVNFVDNNAGLLSPFTLSCNVDGTDGICFVGLFDQSGSGNDMATASLGITGSLADENLGRIEYSFSVVPVPAAVWLFGSALVGLAGFTRARKSA